MPQYLTEKVIRNFDKGVQISNLSDLKLPSIPGTISIAL